MSNRMRTLLIVVVVVLAGVVGIAFWLARAPQQASSPQTATGKVVWRYSVWGPPRAFTTGIEYAKKVLEEAGQGRFELSIQYASALAPEKEHLDAIKIGLVEGAHVCVGYAPAKTPLAQVLELPFLLTEDIAVNAKVMDAVLSHPLLEAELGQWNAKYLMLALLSRYEFMGNRRIAKIEDLNGVRVRISGANSTLLEQYGAVPTMVTAPEAYTALERGTIDLVGFPWTDSFGVFRLHEVSKYATDGIAMSGFGCFSAVSRDAWNALPPDLQALLPRIREEGIQTMIRAYDEGDRKWLPVFRQKLEIVPFPQEERKKLVARAAPLWDKWAAETDAKGLKGSEILAFTKAQIAKFAR